MYTCIYVHALCVVLYFHDDVFVYRSDSMVRNIGCSYCTDCLVFTIKIRSLDTAGIHWCYIQHNSVIAVCLCSRFVRGMYCKQYHIGNHTLQLAKAMSTYKLHWYVSLLQPPLQKCFIRCMCLTRDMLLLQNVSFPTATLYDTLSAGFLKAHFQDTQ